MSHRTASMKTENYNFIASLSASDITVNTATGSKFSKRRRMTHFPMRKKIKFIKNTVAVRMRSATSEHTHLTRVPHRREMKQCAIASSRH